MLAHKVTAAKADLADPTSAVWAKGQVMPVSLIPTPLVLQPSPWLVQAFDGRSYGKLAAAGLSFLHNGQLIAARVEWSVPTPAVSTRGPDEFADACAVILPFVRDAPLITMGSVDQWVNMWLWRADSVGPFTVTAAGLGTTQRIQDGVLEAKGIYRDGRWHVAFVRLLAPGTSQDHVSLKPGTPWQVSLALWQGANQERAGLKSFSPGWMPLEIA